MVISIRTGRFAGLFKTNVIRDLGMVHPEDLRIVSKVQPSEEQMRDLLACAQELGLEALVETHTGAEVALALEAGARVIGVNNRDLHTFNVSLETSLQLRPLIPSQVVMVAESGISSPADLKNRTLGVWFFGNEFPFMSWMSQLGISTDGK